MNQEKTVYDILLEDPAELRNMIKEIGSKIEKDPGDLEVNTDKLMFFVTGMAELARRAHREYGMDPLTFFMGSNLALKMLASILLEGR